MPYDIGDKFNVIIWSRVFIDREEPEYLTIPLAQNNIIYP